eukprot:CAMPEP_0197309542 /NCGR_PEP_ID=MMETSP0891-20130614/8116_1 /TAXON_ID=44058 ORGANISM="Aureoumbra lagunensis, Strain CCMP1510" /NCGR_SAMPLE_ID=MMETSP0891 /ASSEMBLY_ACC=CAM_ASM_000534 /LENGTH=383 /DNA_ID=CAMNT_0042794661 /DNA_START=824 /DNA_END=1972 /DNA_ORIENTATION=+
MAWLDSKFLLLGLADGEILQIDTSNGAQIYVHRIADGRPLSFIRIHKRSAINDYWCVWSAVSQIELCRLDASSGLPINGSEKWSFQRRGGTGLRNLVSATFLRLSTTAGSIQEEYLAFCDADECLELWTLPNTSIQKPIQTNWQALWTHRPPVPHAWAIAASPSGTACCFLQHIRFDTVKRNDAHSKLHFASLLVNDTFDTTTLKSMVSAQPRLTNNQDWLWLRLQSRLYRMAAIDRDSIVGNAQGTYQDICSQVDAAITEITSWDLSHLDTSLLHVAHTLAVRPHDVSLIRNELASRYPLATDQEKKNTDETCLICHAVLLDTKDIRRRRGRVQCTNGHTLLTSSHTGRLIPLEETRAMCPACTLSIAPGDHPANLCPFCRV